MPRLIVLLSLTTLCLLASCVDVKKPAKVSRCEQDNTCTDGTGGATGGKGGATAGVGGNTSLSADAGVSDAPAGGRGGESGRTGGAGGNGGDASGGNTDGGAAGQGGTQGSATGGSATGGTSGGSSGSADAGTMPAPDAEVDKPLGDVPFDTKTKLDGPPDTRPGPEASRPEPAPEPGPDAPPDISPDRMPDRPDTAFDTSTCIQTLKSSGYSLSTWSDAGINACSECKDNNGNSLETPCRTMIDCLVPLWVCRPGNFACWINCRNSVAGDMVLDGCVSALVNKACP